MTRSHAGVGYWKPASRRPNLHTVTEALIERVELDNREDRVVATGVTFTYNGAKYTAHARKEVLVCGGAFGSPAILERSGIGSKSLLQKHGIDTVIDNPNVGENLQDHQMCPISLEMKDEYAKPDVNQPEVIQGALAQYQTSQSGMFTRAAGNSWLYAPLVDFLPPQHSQKEIAALIDQHLPDPSKPHRKAERQYEAIIRKILESPSEASAGVYFGTIQLHGHQVDIGKVLAQSEPGSYATMLPGLAHPLSRGCTHIQSADAEVHPRIEANFYSHPLDLEIMARQLMQCEQILQTQPLSGVLKKGGRRLQEGHNALTLEAAKGLAKHSTISNWHPCATCAMLPEEMGGVVNDRLIVHGTKNLRVIDASIFRKSALFTKVRDSC
jgi:choline dehydrogenase-like flavoprotein